MSVFVKFISKILLKSNFTGGNYTKERCCLTLVKSMFCLLVALDLHHDQKDAILFRACCTIGNRAIIKAYIRKVTQ